MLEKVLPKVLFLLFAGTAITTSAAAGLKLAQNFQTSDPGIQGISIDAPTPSPQPANTLCLVTLFGQTFDVTSLRSTHPGGDIFVCGTDMTSVYQSQHGSSLARMQPYLYNPQNSSPSAPAPTLNPTQPSDKTNETEPRYEKIEDEKDEEEPDLEDHEENNREEEPDD